MVANAVMMMCVFFMVLPPLVNYARHDSAGAGCEINEHCPIPGVISSGAVRRLAVAVAG
jgi:hypothetical protein